MSASRSKLSQFQAIDQPDTLIVPKEMVEQSVNLSRSAADKMITRPKRPQTEAQKAATAKLVEMNRLRAEERRKPEEIAKRKAEEELARLREKEAELERLKAEQAAKLADGSHVKVVLKPKKTRAKRIVVQLPSETETTDMTETEAPTETEDDTDVEAYKSKARVARRAKTVVKTIKKIDQVLQQPVNTNPYASMLASRWK